MKCTAGKFHFRPAQARRRRRHDAHTPICLISTRSSTRRVRCSCCSDTFRSAAEKSTGTAGSCSRDSAAPPPSWSATSYTTRTPARYGSRDRAGYVPCISRYYSPTRCWPPSSCRWSRSPCGSPSGKRFGAAPQRGPLDLPTLDLRLGHRSHRIPDAIPLKLDAVCALAHFGSGTPESQAPPRNKYGTGITRCC